MASIWKFHQSRPLWSYYWLQSFKMIWQPKHEKIEKPVSWGPFFTKMAIKPEPKMVSTRNFHHSKLSWSFNSLCNLNKIWQSQLTKLEKWYFGTDFGPIFAIYSIFGSKSLTLRCVRNIWTFRKSKQISICFTPYQDIHNSV